MGTVLLLKPCGLLVGVHRVSVPFSMGTVLLPVIFRGAGECQLFVSVPFSMGTVLLRSSARFVCSKTPGFSPLLDGDGVASQVGPVRAEVISGFQSPSRWGRCCFDEGRGRVRFPALVSVPFSMGTVLLRRDAFFDTMPPVLFQSPSRWGRCCFVLRAATIARAWCFSPLLDGDGVASKYQVCWWHTSN